MFYFFSFLFSCLFFYVLISKAYDYLCVFYAFYDSPSLSWEHKARKGEKETGNSTAITLFFLLRNLRRMT
jgi:hypothetical protein